MVNTAFGKAISGNMWTKRGNRVRCESSYAKVSFSKVISLEKPKLLRGVKIYPSPVKDVLTVETDAKGDYQVINLLGEQVAQGQLDNLINVSTLPQGIYVLKIGVEQMKFIKQ